MQFTRKLFKRFLATQLFLLLSLPFTAAISSDNNPFFSSKIRPQITMLGTTSAYLDICADGAPDWQPDNLPAALKEQSEEVFSSAYENGKRRAKCSEKKTQKALQFYNQASARLQQEINIYLSSFGASSVSGIDLTAEAAELKSNCELSPYYTHFHDCSCIVKEYITRSKAYLSDKSNDPSQRINRIQKEAKLACLGTRDRMEAYEYTNCFDLYRTQRPDAEPFCVCVAKSVVNDFLENPVIKNNDLHRKWTVAAYKICDNPDPATTLPTGVSTPTDKAAAIIALKIDGMSLDMPPEALRAAALAAGYQEQIFDGPVGSFKGDHLKIKMNFQNGKISRLVVEGKDLSDAEWNDYYTKLSAQFSNLPDACRQKSTQYLKCRLNYRNSNDNRTAKVDMQKNRNKLSFSVYRQLQ